MSTDSVTLQAHYLKADRIMLGVIWFLLAYSCGIAAFYGNWAQALVIGGLTAVSMTALYLLIPGQRLLRCLIGAAFMVLAALQINQAHGLLEMHFGIFALLAFLVYYRDWLPIVVAAATIAVHHLSFFALQQQGAGVYLVPDGTWGVVFLHAFYVVLESAILIYLAIRANAEAREGEALLGAAAAITAHPERIDLSCRSRASGPVTQRFNHIAGPARRTGRRGGARHRRAGRHRGQPEHGDTPATRGRQPPTGRNRLYGRGDATDDGGHRRRRRPCRSRRPGRTGCESQGR